MTSEWKRVSTTIKTRCYRTGWRGVWDAILCLFGGEAVVIARDTTFSVVVKIPDGAEVKIFAEQLEFGAIEQ